MSNNNISLPDAISIGIGGMIGAGIFSILGVVAAAAGSAMWLSFLIGGVIALFSTYSYAKLGAKFPSAGGAVEFIFQGWGKGVISGGVNTFMWLGYIISIALYAQGFSAYCLTFFPEIHGTNFSKAIACGIVLVFTLINLLGAGDVGKAELLIVTIKVSILVLFAAVGLFHVQPQNFAVANWTSIESIFFGAGVLFIGYEGFGLITNTAANMINPDKNIPKALYISMLIVIAIYLAISITVIGNLSIDAIHSSGDTALAQAAQPFLGVLGFKLIAIAALFSTASAINATLFGAANISYMIARYGELPTYFERTTWRGASSGLLITTLLIIMFILFFDLAGVTMMGSGAFLLIYAAVNAGHLRILKQTGANKLLVIISLLLCLILFAILEIYTFKNSPAAVYTMLILLSGCFIFEKLRNSN
jgi:amino acid transporter